MNNNTQESRVTLEVAQALKDKGFRVRVSGTYINGVLSLENSKKGDFNDVDWVRTWRSSPEDDTLSAPTTALAITWVRDNFHIHICTIPAMVSPSNWCSNVIELNKDSFVSSGLSIKEFYSSPEEAENAAILDTLNNLI